MYKEEVLADAHPTCALEQVKMDLAERTARQELFQRINAQAVRVLVLTEGLLVYLTQEQVVQLIEDLHTQPRFHWLLNTSGPSQVLRFLQRLHGRQLTQGNSALHLLSEGENALFRSLGWKVAIFRSMLAESEQFKRAWPSAVMKLLGESAETRDVVSQKGGMTLYTRV